MSARRRLDAELVRRGLAGSRAEAQDVIDRGLVLVGGRRASKASTMVASDEPVDVRDEARRFVSRGGDKLEAALDRFAIDVEGRLALDAGASTGGFTDVLLRRGARRVAAVDVGYGQLAWSLRQHPRVTVLERTNVRDVTNDMLGFAPSVVAADLSFISLRLVLTSLVAVAAPDADLVVLVKPQFEARPGDVGEGGVVRDPAVWRSVLAQIAAASADAGLTTCGVMASPVTGPAGNVEFLMWDRMWDRVRSITASVDEAAIDGAVDEGLAIRAAR